MSQLGGQAPKVQIQVLTPFVLFAIGSFLGLEWQFELLLVLNSLAIFPELRTVQDKIKQLGRSDLVCLALVDVDVLGVDDLDIFGDDGHRA